MALGYNVEYRFRNLRKSAMPARVDGSRGSRVARLASLDMLIVDGWAQAPLAASVINTVRAIKTVFRWSGPS